MFSFRNNQIIHKYAVSLQWPISVFTHYFIFQILFRIIATSSLGLTHWSSAWVSWWVIGWRFDLSVLAAVFLFPLLFAPWISKRGYELLSLLFLVVSIIPSVIDLELLSHTGQRLTVQLIAAGQDVQGEWGQWIIQYPKSILALGLYIGTLGALDRRLHRSIGPPSLSLTSWPKRITPWAILPLCLLAVRGSLGARPLNPNSAFQFDDPKMGALALHSTFSLVESWIAARTNQLPPIEPILTPRSKLPVSLYPWSESLSQAINESAGSIEKSAFSIVITTNAFRVIPKFRRKFPVLC